MTIHCLVNSIFASCTYILDIGKGHTWVVDPGDYKPLLSSLNGRSLDGVLLTHGHFDHIYGLNDVCKYFQTAVVYTNSNGQEALLTEKLNLSKYHETPYVFTFPERIRIINNEDHILLGNGMFAKVLATPGHHPSCLTYIVGDAIFTGDAFISGLKVVTNLPNGNKIQALQSLELIHRYALGRTIYPGHKTEP